MKAFESLKKQTSLLALISLFSAVLSSQTAQATEEIKLKYLDSIKVMEFSKDMKLRGFQLGQGVYMGQAKIAGKYGFGVVVDRKSYSWGINNRGIAIQKSF